MMPQSWNMIGKRFEMDGVEVALCEYDDFLDLELIEVSPSYRGQGLATQVMQQIATFAKESGKTLVLFASNEMGSDTKKLKAFYKRFGFVEGVTLQANSKHNMYMEV